MTTEVFGETRGKQDVRRIETSGVSFVDEWDIVRGDTYTISTSDEYINGVKYSPSFVMVVMVNPSYGIGGVLTGEYSIQINGYSQAKMDLPKYIRNLTLVWEGMSDGMIPLMQVCYRRADIDSNKQYIHKA